jgi:DNA-binding MarR family transcriptional regulator
MQSPEGMAAANYSSIRLVVRDAEKYAGSFPLHDGRGAVATKKTQRKREPAGASPARTPRSRHDSDSNGTASELIVLLANKLTSGASNVYRDTFGVGTVEWRILAHVAAERWISPQRICRLGGLDKGGVSRSMKFLLDRGLIAVRNSAIDARSVEIALTAKGQTMHDRIARVAGERERRLLSGLSKPRIRELLETLRRLNERVHDVNDMGNRA